MENYKFDGRNHFIDETYRFTYCYLKVFNKYDKPKFIQNNFY